MKRKTGRLAILLLSLNTSVPVNTVYAKEWDEVDLKEAVYTDADDLQPFVAYIYIENNEDNPFNNPQRDVTVYFGGDRNLYTTSCYYNFSSDDIYERYNIVRIIGELPGNTEVPYHIHPYASDARATDFAYKSMYFDTEVALMDDVYLTDGYNEFYFVGGSANYIDAHGYEKLMEMYDLFHSNTGSVNENKASVLDIKAVPRNVAETKEILTSVEASESEKEAIAPQKAKRRPTFLAYAIVAIVISIGFGFIGSIAYKREKADEDTYED